MPQAAAKTPQIPSSKEELEKQIRGLSQRDLNKLTKVFEEYKKQAYEDPIFFFDNFLRIYNPKREETDIPFKTYPFQKRLIRQIIQAIETGWYKNEQADLFIDKTREMGVTYVMLGVLLWFWLTKPGFTALVGSRKEDLVDNRRGGLTGNNDSSLFAKLDYMIQRLPPFMVPKEFERRRHFPFMQLINPENGNVIEGESSTGDFGRGARKTVIFFDEFAFFENAYNAWGSTKATTNCRIVVTTPGSKPGKAKRLRHGDDGEIIKVIELPHTLHPDKTAKWLAKQKEEMSEEDFNREIMRDWGLSIKGRIYPELDKADYGKHPFIPGQQLYVSGDYGLDGTVFLFWQMNPKNGKYRLIDSFLYEDEPIEFFFPLFGKPPDSMFTYDRDCLKAFEEISQLPPGIHFGDPSASKRSGNAEKKSDKDKLAEIGIYVYTYTKDNSIDYRVKQTKVFLNNGIEVNESERNFTTFDLMKQYRWKTWEEDHDTTATFRKPIHNNASHSATAMEYFFVNIKNFATEAPPPPPNYQKQRFLTSRHAVRR